MSTGFPTADATDDFLRARRRQVVHRLAARLRGDPGGVDVILPFDEVVTALGQRSQRYLGLRNVPLDAIVGTAGRAGDFDRAFRPTTNRPRRRFEALAAAARRGEPLPPIDVYRVGEAYFVRDGHHRVAVARALGHDGIDAYVTEVRTELGATADLTAGDLPLKSHERVFFERVPLPAAARSRFRFADLEKYGHLAEAVEAWGFRFVQARREFLDRRQVAEAWLAEEYLPTVALLQEAGLLDPDEPEPEGYMRLSAERYFLLRTHAWDDGVVERLRRSPPPGRRG